MMLKLKNRLHRNLDYNEFKEIFNFNVEEDHATFEENVKILFMIIDGIGNKSLYINKTELKETIYAYKLNFSDK